MAPQVNYAVNDGVHLAYQVWGEGERDLVVVLGFISHLDLIWSHPEVRSYLEGFGSFARVIMFDRRGTGLSDPITVTTAPDLDTRMRDIVAVMDAAGSARATIVGASEGGPAAILFAATHPDRAEALALIGAMARSTRSEDHPWLPEAEDFQQSRQEFMLPVWGTGAVVEVAAPSRSDDPDVLAWCGRLERSISPGMIASVAAMFLDSDVRSVLPSIRVPTLVLHRRGDRLVNVRSGRYLGEHIPGAEMVEIPGTDHFPFFERATDFTYEIERFVTGSRPPATSDRRVATILFSDIVGSTERAAALGDARWRDLLARHDRIVRAELARTGGVEVKSLGDGFLATFDGPTAAIRGACAIRDAFAASELDVRIGLHTGEVEIIDEDIGGIAVHIAARVSTLASAGEILASRTVKDLVAGSGVVFESRGSHTLRGLPDQWEIVAVAG